jgi:predicted Zn-dependent protease
LIVITDEMVQAAESVEEIGAVLAHEIGHVERRHSMRHVIQGSAIGLIMATLTADAASLSIAVAGAPAALAQAKYSRDFETEADDYAFTLLKARGRSPAAFADLMDRLSRGNDESEQSLGFLSSHPVTRERVLRARSAAAR